MDVINQIMKETRRIVKSEQLRSSDSLLYKKFNKQRNSKILINNQDNK